MADERSPLLQSGRVHEGAIDYSAVNEAEQTDSIANQGSTDEEQQEIVVAPQHSVITLVRLGKFLHYFFYSNTASGPR